MKNQNNNLINAQTTIRRAWPDDEPMISRFVDSALPKSDFFVQHGKHKSYIQRYKVFIAELFGQVIGWSVIDRQNKLIHLLVHPDYRRHGIGTELLKVSAPKIIRSKSDQSTGNPINWYQKHGYTLLAKSTGKNRNIDILIKGDSIHFD